MNAAHRKKLIEVALPLEKINEASAREKSIRHGHPSTLHLWWARRPLAACRAVLFGQLVDDPASWPERFATEDAQAGERKRLFEIIERLVRWENSTNEAVLGEARHEIARSLAWNRGEEPPPRNAPEAVLAYLQEHAPPVYDPFCGGGSIPLEAQRLGLKAYGSDLNPVAVLISKALVEIPPKFAGQPPVNPEAQDKLAKGGRWSGKGAQGLAEDVRYYGAWMRERAAERIGHLYPEVEVTGEAVRQQPALAHLEGEKLTVIAWLWARTVKSPNPAAKGARVPLVSSFMLSTKKSRKTWVEPVLDPDAPEGYRFEVQSGELSAEEEAEKKKGTKAARGANFTCVLTGTPMSKNHIREEFKAKRSSERLMAIVADGPKGRVYLPATSEHERIAASAEPSWKPEAEMNQDSKDLLSGRGYGFRYWHELFTRRQLVALTTFSDLVGEAREQALADARAAGRADESTPLHAGGTGAQATADAIATYLGMALSRQTNYSSKQNFWSGDFIVQAFGRQALPMVWDYSETNLFSKSTGDWLSAIQWVYKSLLMLIPVNYAQIDMKDAMAGHSQSNKSVISTDPPYYDNIGYADLSDYFYVWTRRTLNSLWPDLFRTVLVPKSSELVASPYRHGSRENAEAFFMEGMRQALQNLSQTYNNEYPVAIYYAFKQSEVEKEGVASTGWATFLQATFDAGFLVDGTLPIRTERSTGLKASVNALASSIVLVCRKRPAEARVATRGEFIAALRRELPGALKLLQQGSIAPVDMAQASIGPGMAVFSRYAKVLEADDSPMSVKTALQIINAELDTFLSEQEAEFDEWTRFAVTWFETHGMEAKDYGDAETLATARGVSVDGVARAGIIAAGGSKVRLLKREELCADWDPEADNRFTVWECTQHLIRRLDEGGERAAAALLARIGEKAEPARDLAYRLYQICDRKKWAEEGRAYNGLVILWRDLLRLAAEERRGPAQAEMFGS